MYGTALDTAVHVTPFADLLRTVDVIVGYIHASGIAYLAIDDHNLAVVAWNDVVDPRETDRIELHQLDAQGIDGIVHLSFDGLIVGGIAKCIIKRTHFHPFSCFLCQDMEQKSRYRVVTEIEVFKVNERLGIAHSLKHVLKFVMTRLQQLHGIAIIEFHTLRPQMSSHQGISSLRTHGHHQRDAEYQYNYKNNSSHFLTN